MKIIVLIHQQPNYHFFFKKDELVNNFNGSQVEEVRRKLVTYEFLHLLGEAVYQLTDTFEYEVWQTDLTLRSITTYKYESGLIHKLFPAEIKKKLYGLKFKKEILSSQMLTELQKISETNDLLLHLNSPLSGMNHVILEKFNNFPILFSFHGEIDLPSVRFFSISKNIFSKINLFTDYLWLKKYIGRIKYITFMNHKNLALLKKIYKGPTELVTAGCDFSFFKKLDKRSCRIELDLPIDKFIIISVGRLDSLKQIDNFIKVLKGVDSKYDFLYIVAGSGKEEGALKQLSLQLIKKGKILFVGYLPKEKLIKYLNSSDLFVLTSISEGASVAVMEAFACEVPVFSTRTGHTAELMQEEGVGCLVEARGYKEWLRKLEVILKTKKLPKILNRDIAQKHYDWKNVAKKFLKIYESMPLKSLR